MMGLHEGIHDLKIHVLDTKLEQERIAQFAFDKKYSNILHNTLDETKMKFDNNNNNNNNNNNTNNNTNNNNNNDNNNNNNNNNNIDSNNNR